MKVTRKDASNKCVLSMTERRTLRNASLIIEQIAWFGRPMPVFEQLAKDVGYISDCGEFPPADTKETTEA